MSSGHLHPQYNLRWPEELRQKVAQSAKEHNRSMNADIVARLEQSFEQGLNHETEMHMMSQVVKDQQKQIDQLHEMVKQLVFRPRQMDD